MLFKRSSERFNPLEHSTPLTEEDMVNFGVNNYSSPKTIGDIDNVYFVKNSFQMQDGWNYDAISTVLPPDKLVTPVSGTMTGGWFTGMGVIKDRHGFNARRMATLGKLGEEWTFVSVPTNHDRGWGDMEANARNQARIGRAMARMLGRHSLSDNTSLGRDPDLFTVDGLSRGAMHGESVAGVAPELGAAILFAYYTVACRINGVQEVEYIADVVRQLTPKKLAQIAMRGEIPDELTLAHIIKTARRAGSAIGETFGNELKPFAELLTEPLSRIRRGESLKDAIGDTMGKFHPNSIVIPYEIISRYPGSIDLRRIDRQVLEAYTLTDGTYGELAEKVSPDQFQVHTGFSNDGLSHFEEVVARHDPTTHRHTIIEAVEGGNHVTSIIEEKNQEWKKRWTTVIEVLGEIGVEKLKEMSRTEQWETLHAQAATKNKFFADKDHPHHPTPHTPLTPGSHHVQAA